MRVQQCKELASICPGQWQTRDVTPVMHLLQVSKCLDARQMVQVLRLSVRRHVQLLQSG